MFELKSRPVSVLQQTLQMKQYIFVNCSLRIYERTMRLVASEVIIFTESAK